MKLAETNPTARALQASTKNTNAEFLKTEAKGFSKLVSKFFSNLFNLFLAKNTKLQGMTY